MANLLWEYMEREYHKERKTQAFFKTQGFKKLWNYARAVIDGTEFQKMVRELRKEYQIPKDGFVLPEEGSWTHPPKEWEHYEDRRVIEKIRKILNEFVLKQSLLPKDWTYTFESYLLYNRAFLGWEPGRKNICFVTDSIKNVDGTGSEIGDDERQVYPVTLHISPYASERDILDYVKNVYRPEIERMQKQYQNPNIKIGKFRKRKESVRERDKLLLDSKKSNKGAGALARAKFPEKPLKTSSVGKTIARERKRRKEV